ncbi:MarR family winged helix-turn-helix transcriptional regulator [Microlunatus endophyticus]|uniref:MarR family winged helix-turn-helix transcriptional regulator n=1 Tax=Microlunatus endophyticus TaxID=1716077 RepID=UPI00166D7282|nr:MarR family transcriptional regulator [Microlunatus endophyticus]
MSRANDREVCLLVTELAKQIDDHLRSHVHGLGLTPSQALALRELQSPLAMRELATRMACEASNVTFVVDRLEAGGLVERVAHPDDRRTKRVRLTEAGRSVRARLMRQLTKDSPLGGLDDHDRQQLEGLLAKAVRT